MSSGSAPASANSTPSSWAGSVSSDPSLEKQGLWSGIRLWWAEFSLQTKLLAIATLVVSLMMTSITFFALNGIQRDAVMNDTRYARDLGLLLAGNVTELVADGHDRELANVAEQFWRSSRSLRYIFFADPEGVVYLGIPISGK
jgi:two-component system sensor histidine kinase NblS